MTGYSLVLALFLVTYGTDGNEKNIFGMTGIRLEMTLLASLVRVVGIWIRR